MTERQKELATGFVIIGGLILALLIGEGALRLLQVKKFGVANTVEDSTAFYVDAKSGLRLPKPGSRIGEIRINSLGFRSPEITITKPPGVVRLAFLGSSTTYDAYADGQSNWPYLTWRNLQQALPACRFDYLNAGSPGFSARRSKTQLEHHIQALKPDAIIFLPSEISNALDNLAVKKSVHNGEHFASSWLAKHSVLWAKIEKNVQVLRLQRAAHLEKGKLQFDPEEITDDLKSGLADFLKAARATSPFVAAITVQTQLRGEQDAAQQRRAANTGLFYMPYMSVSGLLKAERTYNAVITSVAQDTGVALLDARGSVPGDSLHYADTSHFRAAGSKAFAERVSTLLLADPGFRALLDRASCRQDIRAAKAIAR